MHPRDGDDHPRQINRHLLAPSYDLCSQRIDVFPFAMNKVFPKASALPSFQASNMPERSSTRISRLCKSLRRRPMVPQPPLRSTKLSRLAHSIMGEESRLITVQVVTRWTRDETEATTMAQEILGVLRLQYCYSEVWILSLVLGPLLRL